MTPKQVSGLLTLIGLLVMTAAVIWWTFQQPWDHSAKIGAVGAVIFLWGGLVYYADK